MSGSEKTKPPIVVKISIRFRDDKIQTFICSDTPFIGTDWITLCPFNSPLGRKIIPKEAIADIEWDYELYQSNNQHEKKSREKANVTKSNFTVSAKSDDRRLSQTREVDTQKGPTGFNMGNN